MVLLLWLLIVPMNLEAAGNSNREYKPISGAQSFDLSTPEVEDLKRKGDAGDAVAARKLSQYYGLAKNDLEQETLWLRKAAELGDLLSQHNIAYRLIHDEEYRNIDEANQWLQRAKVNAEKEGDVDMLEAVHSLEEDLHRMRASQ